MADEDKNQVKEPLAAKDSLAVTEYYDRNVGNKVNLKTTVKVKFTKDFGYNRKGKVQKISKVMYDLYKAKGVVEEVK